MSKGKTASWEFIMKDKRFRYLPSQMTKLESGKAETGLSMGSTTENTVQKESKRQKVESKIRAEQQRKRDEPSEGSDGKAITRTP